MAINQPPKTQCGVGTACYGCGRQLPLRLTEQDEGAATWECVHCHIPIVGILSPKVLRMFSRQIRLSAFHFDVDRPERLTDAILQIAHKAAYRDRHNKLRDSRRSQRISGQREVAVLCLDEQYRLSGPPIGGIVANLSRHGQMLITMTQIDSPLVLTQFENARRTIQLVGRVAWCRYLDVGCYGAGIDFIARFGNKALE